jgi:hypothetical protein
LHGGTVSASWGEERAPVVVVSDRRCSPFPAALGAALRPLRAGL